MLEDEWPARNYLVELLEGTGLAEVVGAIATVDEARAVLAAAKSGVSVDVVFVDVQLMPDGEGAGLELVRELARAPDAPLFVLATAFKEHALEAFELGVADYLLKPFTEERVGACLDRLHARAARSESQPPPPPLRIVARTWPRPRVPRPVGGVGVRGRRSAHVACTRLTARSTSISSLSAIEASLGRSFARVHRNWLVNAAHIKRLDRDGSETTILRRRRAQPAETTPIRAAAARIRWPDRPRRA